MTTARTSIAATRATPATMASAADALRAEEVKRTRDVLRIGWLVAGGVGVAVMLSPGNPTIRNALLVVLAIGIVGSVWMHAQLAQPQNYSPSRMNLLALAALACGQLGILYVGVFSAAPIMVALGLYFFCRTESKTSAVATYSIAAGGHAIEAALVISGLMEDPGFYRIDHHGPSLQAQIVGQGLIQFAYALCFWLARVSRRTSLKSIEQLQKATRLAAQRDVQLAELRQDLDQALKVGGPGRFTGVAVGSWELGVVLGRGAMGEVYEAVHSATKQEAAVKLLRRELLADPRHVERFFREVRIASTIDSPHVVRVLEASTPSDTLPYLAMEKLAGQTLGSLLRKGSTLGDTALLNLVTQVGAVLELARQAGIVHRDLKPQNLFLTFDDLWKVLDFGVALLADSTGTLTRGGAVGTPAYMAPEQARGIAVDHRADIYSLGAVIYRCATGRAPFVKPDTPSLLYAVVEEQPLRPSAVAPLAPAFDDILALALAKDRSVRFQTAVELVDAFVGASRNAPLPDVARRARALPHWSEPAT